MKHSLAIALILLCTGCVTTEYLKGIYDSPGWPGYITNATSEFDNSSRVSLEPAYLYDGTSPFRLGLRWNSKLDKDEFLLVAEWGGAKNFAPKDTLDFNIDGKITSLKPLDRNQYGIVSQKTVMSSGGLVDVPVDMGNQTHKTFMISKDILDKIINAKKVIVRAQLLESFWEERFEPSPDAIPTYNKYPYIWAKAGFKKFLHTIPAS